MKYLKKRSRVFVHYWIMPLLWFPLVATAQLPPDFALDGDDFGFTEGAYDGKLGGTCWYDADKDGLQSTDRDTERGLEGVLLELLDENGHVLETTYTDGSGFYLFDRVDTGNYQIKVTEPENCRLSPLDADGNTQDTRDSDFSVTSASANASASAVSTGGLVTDSDYDEAIGEAMSPILTVNASQPMNFSVDAGFICGEEPELISEARNDDYVINTAGAVTLDVLENDVIQSPVSELTLLSTDALDDIEVINNTIVMRDARTPGNYSLRYKITCDDGSTSEADVAFTLDFPPPPPVLTAVDDTIIMKVGESISMNPFENDVITPDFSYGAMLSTNVPGVATFGFSNRGPLTVSNPTAEGNYEVEYELVSTIGTKSRGIIHVVVEPNEALMLTPPAFITPNTPDGCSYTVENKEGQAIDVHLAFRRWYTSINLGSVEPGETKTFYNIPSYFHVRGPEWDTIDILPKGQPWGSSATLKVYFPRSCHVTMSGDLTINPPRDVQLTDPRTIYGCTVPYASSSSRYIEIAEPTLNANDWADAYRFYGQWGNYLGEASEYVNFTPPYLKRETFQWAQEIVPMGRFYMPSLAYYVSRVVNGIESPALACYHNPHYTTPIALDLNQDGTVERIKGKFEFDFDGDGALEMVSEWFGPNEGILIDRRVGNHISGQHLFGDQGGLFTDGFEKLAMLDIDQSGWVEGNELTHLGIWTDANSNAQLDAGELSTLVDHHIVSLSTHHQQFLSQAKLANGQIMLSEDVWFQVIPPAFKNTTADASVLKTHENRLLMALSLLVLAFIGFTAAGLFNRCKQKA